MTVFVNLGEETKKRLKALSKMTQCPQTLIATEAIESYIGVLEKNYLGETKEGYSDNKQ